ncbi:MAG: MerR family transcriptional regulator [Lachnospiraceae bacterium]|nr:MerR family transcriptional regulator [Lachnospiraceae bacterium]
MRMLIKEFADFTGVSVRTLHYYDEIELLKPAIVDEQTGYRYYDEQSLERMQEILFYRELDFSLKSICSILSSPDYDKDKAMKEQKRLLVLKKQRLERIIEALDAYQKGENVMKAFDNTEFEAARKQYEEEAKEKWGKTAAYAEYAKKAQGYSKDKQNEIMAGMQDILKEFALCMQDGEKPESTQAQELVKKLQAYITANYYTCTNEILAGLGKMYVADERFKKNMDSHAEGTAEYVSEAISMYVSM